MITETLPAAMGVNTEVILTKWIPALRSGEYNQTRRVYHKVQPSGRHEFCAVGVLLDALGVEWSDEPACPNRDFPEILSPRLPSADKFIEETLGTYETVRMSINTEYDGTVLPGTKRLLADTHEWDSPHPNWVHVTSLNDRGYDYDEIADILEDAVYQRGLTILPLREAVL